MEAIPRRLDEESAVELVSGCDVVLDGSDSFATRATANEACARARIPLVSGALGPWEGSLSVFRPWLGTPCWQCLFPERPRDGLVPSCAEAGVLGSLAGVIGAAMATECIKLIVGAGKPLENRLLLYDALDGEVQVLGAAKRAGCGICGTG